MASSDVFCSAIAAGALEKVQPVLELLREIGDRYTKTPSKVSLRWLMENPVVLPIPGAKNGGLATANAGALDFSLIRDEVDALNRLTLE